MFNFLCIGKILFGVIYLIAGVELVWLKVSKIFLLS